MIINSRKGGTSMGQRMPSQKGSSASEPYKEEVRKAYGPRNARSMQIIILF